VKDYKDSRIVIVDDNEDFLELMVETALRKGFTLIPCATPQCALNLLAGEPCDAVITDLSMPQMDGLELFKAVQDLDPLLPVIVITQYGSTEKAVSALKLGAYHYFEKPVRANHALFWKTLEEALIKSRQRHELDRLRRERASGFQPNWEILGVSENIQSIRTAVLEVADFDIDVLITGETGTGKGVVARSLHRRSSRRNGPFLTVNCAELPGSLLESSLFGYEKGAYTGAVTKGTGYFELAHGGTLFLDEVGDASTAMQTKLLRVLEEKTYQRVGGNQRRPSDFRLITATNQDLRQALEMNRFRRDLFYRINTYRIHIAPLRERMEDVPVLARHFIETFNLDSRLRIEGLSARAEEMLQGYHWPGNIRELRNTIVRACVSCHEGLIRTIHLEKVLPPVKPSPTNDPSLNLKEMEARLIAAALKQTGNNQTQAAKLLGVSRNTLIAKLKALHARPDS